MALRTLLQSISRRGNRSSWQTEEARYAFLLLAPMLLLSTALLLYPLLNSFWVSLNDVNVYKQTWTFIGFKNYLEVFKDPLFLTSLKNTLYFALITILGTTTMGLLIALLLNEGFYGRSAARVIIMIPWSLSEIMTALTFGWIYNSQFGALNGLLYQLGIIDTYVAWLSTGARATNLLAIAFIWREIPFAALLFLGALQTVPVDLYQAAKVDGANTLRRFRYVTFPWIKSTLLVVLVVATLSGFLAFGIIYLLTGGGPGNATTFLSWWGYVTTFRDFNLGKGAAIFYILSAAILALSFLYIRLFLREEEGGITL